MAISFSFGYSDALVLPYEEGVKLLATIQKGLLQARTYSSSETTITPLNQDNVKANIINREDFLKQRTAGLLCTYTEEQ